MSIHCLEQMRQYSMEASAASAFDIPKDNLAELCDVKLDASLSGTLRMRQYLEQIENPYCFLCHGIPMHISFVNEDQELSKALVRYFCTLKG